MSKTASNAETDEPCGVMGDLYRITRALGVSDQVARMICSEVQREMWGWSYIPKTTEDDRARLSRRDAEIVRDWRRGEHTKLLARRHSISERRIRQIIGARSETL
jgi:Mor family transcriptional regulator